MVKLQRILTLMLLCGCLMWSALAQGSGITNYDRLIAPDYWTAHNQSGDKLLLDANGIKTFNSKVRSVSRTVVELADYPESINGDALKTQIMDYQLLDDDLYRNGVKVSNNYKNILRTQTNVEAVGKSIVPQYAVTVRRTNIRNLPTREGLFFYEGDTDFDALQETALDPAEPLVVLHKSANGYFYFVQAYNYSGWVYAYDIAFTNKSAWLEYVKPKNFLVVTAKTFPLKGSVEQLLFQQGARLVIKNEGSDYYNLSIPVREQGKGTLVQHTQKVLKKDIASYANKGYVRYTSNNIINAAFKHYGAPYGWGGLKNSVDCSSLVANIYRTFGIILPRNADDQAQTAGKNWDFEGLSDSQRLQRIKALMPGAVLYLDGHIMMYLGKSNEVPFVLHALGSHYEQGVRKSAMRVVVSDLALRRSSGRTFLTELLNAAEYK